MQVIGERIFLKRERVRPSLLMELWPEAAHTSIKHWKHKPRESTEPTEKLEECVKQSQLGNSNPSRPVSINFPLNSHAQRCHLFGKKHQLQQPVICFHSVESLIPPHEQECAAFLSLLLATGIFPLFLHTVTLSTGKTRRHFCFGLWALGK